MCGCSRSICDLLADWCRPRLLCDCKPEEIRLWSGFPSVLQDASSEPGFTILAAALRPIVVGSLSGYAICIMHQTSWVHRHLQACNFVFDPGWRRLHRQWCIHQLFAGRFQDNGAYRKWRVNLVTGTSDDACFDFITLISHTREEATKLSSSTAPTPPMQVISLAFVRNRGEVNDPYR